MGEFVADCRAITVNTAELLLTLDTWAASNLIGGIYSVLCGTGGWMDGYTPPMDVITSIIVKLL